MNVKRDWHGDGDIQFYENELICLLIWPTSGVGKILIAENYHWT